MPIYLSPALIAVLVAIATTLIITHINKKRSAQNKAEAEKYLPLITTFGKELCSLENIYIKHSVATAFSGKWQSLYAELRDKRFSKKHPAFSAVKDFLSQYDALPQTVATLNEKFISHTSEKYDSFFSDIDGKSLDAQQRACVISEEERTLVLAGAGSGKTLTIAAKVKYLCEVKKVSPADILLISFTKKSAQEMTERIKKMGIDIEAFTFHKLGMDILKKALGFRPDVFENLPIFINNFFENDLLLHPELIEAVMKYFAYYLDVPPDLNSLSSLGELYEAEKALDLETLKSKYDKEKYIAANAQEKSRAHTTLQGERVKSIEETKIANFLFMHGVAYEYEKIYPHESYDSEHKNYRPDFYLTDYDIYLEHFGISKDFKVPWLSSAEEKKYLEGIEWKRLFHKTHGTKLIETYSYYSNEGCLLEKLETLLHKNGVTFKERDFTDIYDTIYAKKTNKYFASFIVLCSTFITLFKSRGYKIEKLDEMKNEACKNKNKFMAERTTLFLSIIKIILAEYQKYLAQQNEVDFSDMINLATEKILQGSEVHKYKHIIVDEYQDISLSRFGLIKAIAEQAGAKVFCVGDDWQSIYRFAGSDISLFTEAEKYFGYTKILRIEKTYRNSQSLINEAQSFVLKNPQQLQKSLRSDKTLDFPLVFWGYDNEPHKAVEQIVAKIISEYGKHKNILMLGRTKNDVAMLKESFAFRIFQRNGEVTIRYVPSPDTPITFLSVHKSKGLEADNVIVLNFKNDKLGFPNQIADDPVLNLVLTQAEEYKFAEERRLFYVAITRTKNRTYVLTDNKKPSLFFREFSASKQVAFVSIRNTANENAHFCPRCKTGTLVIKQAKSGKQFVACTNYPMCEYTMRDATLLKNPKRCPSCGAFLIQRRNKNGHAFLGCTNFPHCEYTEEK